MFSRSLFPYTSPPSAHPACIKPQNTSTRQLPHSQSPIFLVVALGGTFDHLHTGHNILFSMGLWLASEKLIVGITSNSLLCRKVHKEQLESLQERCETTRRFVEWFNPGIDVDIVEIDDVYGPTRWDLDVQALVVSEETRSGADAIASHRAANSLPALRTFVINIIPHGSTSIRVWIAEHGMDEVKGI